MRFFADENTPWGLVQSLRDSGHDVSSAAELKPGETDDAWLRLAESEDRVIVTSDKDFGELVFRDGLNTSGVRLLRLEGLPMAERLSRLTAALTVLASRPKGSFIVVTEKKNPRAEAARQGRAREANAVTTSRRRRKPYDQPLEDKKRLRVVGPFTVEALQSYEPISLEELARQLEDVGELAAFEDLIFDHLKSAGVKIGNKSRQSSPASTASAPQTSMPRVLPGRRQGKEGKKLRNPGW